MGKWQIAKEKDIGPGCEQKSCLTCLAKENTSGHKSSTFDMNANQIPGLWSTMRNSIQYMNWTVPQKIDK
eukprot:8620250-Heterocapsa_arctica.AAC.1